MNPTFFKTVGTSAALLLFFGAGCNVAKAPTNMVPSVSNTNTNTNTNVEGEKKKEIVWRTIKNDFSIRVPENWRVSQVDAGGISLIQLASPGATQSDIEITLFSPTDMSGALIVPFGVWVKNGGAANSRIQNAGSLGREIVDGIAFLGQEEDGRVVAYYAQLPATADHEAAYLRYSYSSTNIERKKNQETMQTMQFNLPPPEIEQARVIP